MSRRKEQQVVLSKWYKRDKNDQVWWKETPGEVGEFIFSFDKKEEFNFFADYPQKLTPEQKAIFDKENPIFIKLKEE